MSPARWLLLIGITCLSMSRCRGETKDGYGLPRIDLLLDEKQWQELNQTVTAKVPVTGPLKIDGESFLGEFNYSGKSSLTHVKKSFDIAFADSEWRGLREWRLSAQMSDPSLLRLVLGFRVFKAMDIKVPQTMPVSVYSQSDFLGVYYFIEPVGFDFITKALAPPDRLYKAKFGRLKGATLSLDSLSDLSIGFSIKQGNTNFSDLKHMITTHYQARLTGDFSKLSKIIDIPQWLRYFAVATYLNHWDGFSNNYFITRGRAKTPDALFRVVPWDLDKIYQAPSASLTSPDLNASPLWGFDNELLKTLLSHPDYKSEYVQYVMTLCRDITPEGFAMMVDEEKQKIAKAIAHDRHAPNWLEQTEALKTSMRSYVIPICQEAKQQTQAGGRSR